MHMIELDVVLWILIAHFVGDFVMQTDKMAKGKSTDNVILFHHITWYVVPLMVVSAVTLIPAIWVIINGAAHFVVDYFTSRRSSRQWSEGKVHDFFVTVGFDQLLHYTILLTSYAWVEWYLI